MSRMRGHQYLSSLHMLTESSDVHTFIHITYILYCLLPKGAFQEQSLHLPNCNTQLTTGNNTLLS